jgi:hypothetical protein
VTLECILYGMHWHATTVMYLPLLGLVCALLLAPLLQRLYSRRIVALMSLREVSALPSADVPAPPHPCCQRPSNSL